MEPSALPTVIDVQDSTPTVAISLSRVGVTNVEKVIRIGAPGEEQLFPAKLDCLVDLGPEHKPAPVSGIPTQEIYTP